MRDQVVDLLREEILSGRLAEGNPLREIPLAERFRTSRGPIRDAILQLTQEGLLVSEPNRGAKVAPVWDEHLRPVMVDIRFELESYAVWKIVELEPAHDLAVFRRNLKLFQVACKEKDFKAVVQLDMGFHRLLLRESRVAGLEPAWLPVMGGMRLPYSRHAKLIESYYEHEAIVEALAKRDGETAVAALKKNIR
jgi:DNA-binding GntR family transcriptional regulator